MAWVEFRPHLLPPGIQTAAPAPWRQEEEWGISRLPSPPERAPCSRCPTAQSSESPGVSRAAGRRTVSSCSRQAPGVVKCFYLLKSLTLTPHTVKSSSGILNVDSCYYSSDLSSLLHFPWTLTQLAASAVRSWQLVIPALPSLAPDLHMPSSLSQHTSSHSETYARTMGILNLRYPINKMGIFIYRNHCC